MLTVFSATKKNALSKGTIGCLGEVHTLNVARGCAGNCVFCFARCYTGAPQPGTLLLYMDLPRLLRQHLDNQRRKNPLPPFVVFSSATDSFLGGPQVLQVSRACLEILLNRGVGVSLSTRGLIPEDTIAVLGRFARHVRVTIPLPSLSESYYDHWEPGTVGARERLYLAQRLMDVGIRPKIRIEPLIPFVNDDTDDLREVISAVVGLGLSSATLSYMHLRPGVADQLRTEAPQQHRRLVLGSFVPKPSGSGAGTFQHFPAKLRVNGLRRVQRIGREHGLRVSACHCQNPGIPAQRCPIAPPEVPEPKGEQGQLF